MKRPVLLVLLAALVLAAQTPEEREPNGYPTDARSPRRSLKADYEQSARMWPSS
jgi:hypothetical protein